MFHFFNTRPSFGEILIQKTMGRKKFPQKQKFSKENNESISTSVSTISNEAEQKQTINHSADEKQYGLIPDQKLECPGELEEPEEASNGLQVSNMFACVSDGMNA